jgi:hypothetical protein
MPSTYSKGSKLELMAAGENSGNWGDITNNNLRVLDSISFGFVTITPSGSSSSLATSDGGVSGTNPEDANHRILVYTGTSGAHTVTITPNDVQKSFFVHNQTSHNLTFQQGDGSGGTVTIAASHSAQIYSTGTGINNTAAVREVSAGMQFSDINVTGGNIGGLENALEIADGGTGGTTVTEAQTGLGLLIGTNVQAWNTVLDQLSSTGTPTNNHFFAVQEDSGNPGTYTWQSLNASTARTAMGVAIGSNVQAYDDGLNSIAGLTTAADKMIYTTGFDVYAVTDLTQTGRDFIGAADANAAVTTLDANFTDATKLVSLMYTTLGTVDADRVVTVDTNKDVGEIRILKAAQFSEKFVDNGTTSTFDINTASVFEYNPTSATPQVTFTNYTPPTGETRSWTLIVKPTDNTAIDWNNTIKWPNGLTPPSPRAGNTFIYTFLAVQGFIYGFLAGDAMN